MMVYDVTAKNSTGAIENHSFVFWDMDYAHSSHLVFIMRTLDDKYLDMVSITVA